MIAAPGLEIRRWAELDDGGRADALQCTAGRAALSDPLRSPLAQRFYAAYFGTGCFDLTRVALQYGKPIGYLPASLMDAQASYFGMPAKAFADTEATRAALLHSLVQDATRKGCRTLKLDQRDAATFSCGGRLGPIHAVDTALVDLALEPAAIKAGLRKSYKSLVNWGQRHLELRFIDRVRADREAFLAFREFHRKVSGRSTRSDETWEIQFEMILQGEAFALLGYYKARLVSANLVQHSDSEAYYGVGVYDREMMAERLPVAHGPLFSAILRAREIGLKRFVLGDASDSDDEKLANIARFKRGFATAIETGGWMECQLA